MEKTTIQTIGISRTDKKTGRTVTKQYATVDSRVEFFREKYPDWSIETDYPLIDLSKGYCMCRATIKNEKGVVVSQGSAYEWTSKPGSMVNSTSYVENAETSAVGRALGFLGIGINGMGIASAEEVQTAITHQENNDLAPIDDFVPFSEPETPKRAGPDDWLTTNAFEGIAARTDNISDLQRILNEQRDNPHLRELAEIATARKREIMDNLQMQGA